MYNENNFEALDIITLLGFIAQISNIHNDEEYHKYLSEEIKKLHEENEIIIEQNKKIISLLERGRN